VEIFLLYIFGLWAGQCWLGLGVAWGVGWGGGSNPMQSQVNELVPNTIEHINVFQLYINMDHKFLVVYGTLVSNY
jgi:hypothetical protein